MKSSGTCSRGICWHVDFLQINMEREVSATVRVNLKGDPVGVKQEGGVLQTEVYDVDIQCLPGKIPMEITADISQLHIGDSLLVKDLQLPEGVELLSDPDQYIASVVPPQKPEETDGGGEQTEGKAETTE